MLSGMSTEVWFRNPDNYVKELLEVGVTDFIWDFGYLYKKRIDAKRWADLYLPSTDYKVWVMAEKGAYMFDQDTTPDAPRWRANVWNYGEPLHNLETAMVVNFHDTPDGRIIVNRLPSMHQVSSKAFLRTLFEMQEDYPESTLHLHGLYGYNPMFGDGFKSVDYDPRTGAQKGKICLPNGKEIAIEYAPDYKMWIDLLEVKMHELRVPRNRCMYNIKSAVWAGKHYKEAIKFRTRGQSHVPDPDNPNPKPPTTQRIMLRNKKSEPGDLFLCDLCSLQTTCRYFRASEVCIVPDSETKPLADYFKSRDPEVIMEGMTTLMAAGTRRLEKALAKEDEAENGALNPEVTKIIHGLFDRGEKLVKLRNPSLVKPGAAPSLTQINIGEVNGRTPQALMAGIVESFVQQGIARDQITPEMVLAVLDAETQQRALDVGSREAS